MVAVGEVEPGSRKQDQRVDPGTMGTGKGTKVDMGERGVGEKACRNIHMWIPGDNCLYVHQSAIAALAVTRVRPAGGVAQQLFSLLLSCSLSLSLSVSVSVSVSLPPQPGELGDPTSVKLRAASRGTEDGPSRNRIAVDQSSEGGRTMRKTTTALEQRFRAARFGLHRTSDQCAC